MGGGSLSMVLRYQAYEPLVRFTMDWSGVEPNVAESYEVSEGGKVYTFKLRKGMKWSDGEPFTTEDVRFWYEDIFLDPDVSQPTGPGLLDHRRREGQARDHRRDDLQGDVPRA